MQELLASYLFQYKKCPLPSLGHLAIVRTEAVVVPGEKKILSPRDSIQFSADELNAGDLESYIAAQTSVNKEEASYQLGRYCSEIKNMQPGDKRSIPGAGEFYIDAENYIAFLPAETPASFSSEIFAERVIHPDKTHTILVGDTETTNAVMTEYFAEETPKAKSRWWIAALILFMVAVVAIVLYFNDKNRNGNFGISHKYEVSPSPQTYRVLP